MTWNTTDSTFRRMLARGMCATPGGILVGDYATGNVYLLDPTVSTDNGAIVRRLRRAPYPSAENQWTFLDQVELGVQSGSGTASGQGVAPQVMLSISRDSGYNWDPPVAASIGATGQYAARAVWHRLGRVRADRLVLEVSQTDPVPMAWGPGLWLRARPGTGQL